MTKLAANDDPTPSAEERAFDEWWARQDAGKDGYTISEAFSAGWQARQAEIEAANARWERAENREAIRRAQVTDLQAQIEAARREQMEADCAVAQECHGNPSVGHQDHGFKVCRVVDAIRAAFDADNPEVEPGA